MNMKFSQYNKAWKISVLTAAVLLSACGGGGGDSSGVIISSPTDNVIHADINQSNQKDFTVSVGDQNIGAVGQSNTYPVTVKQSNPSAGFTVNLGTCAQAISNGQSCQFSLSYAPTTDAQYNQQDVLTISVGSVTQTINVKGTKGQDFVVFGDSLSDAGVQDELASFVNKFHKIYPAVVPMVWPTIPNTSDNKEATYTTPGGHVWATVLGNLVGQSPALSKPNNINYMYPARYRWPALRTESATLNGNNYAQGGATTTCEGIGVKILKVPLYIPAPIGPIPTVDGTVHGKPLYSCPQDQFVPAGIEKYNQIDSYLSQNGNNADPDKVYILWGGANNLFLEIQKYPNPTKTEAAEIVQAMMQAEGDISYDVKYLAKHGATKFVVLLLPDIGLTPLATKFMTVSLRSSVEKVVLDFDRQLRIDMISLQKKHSDIKIVTIDVFNLMVEMVEYKEMSALGKTYSFGNVVKTACTQNPPSKKNPFAALTNSAIFCTPQVDQTYLFEDTVHPTAETHQLIAAKIAKAMEAFD